MDKKLLADYDFYKFRPFTFSLKYPSTGQIKLITVHAKTESEAVEKWKEYKKRLGINQKI